MKIDRSRPGWVAKEKCKADARNMVAKARARGEIKREPCAVCGEDGKVVAHHEDYDKPLDVIWLCRTHHSRRHVELDGKGDHGVGRALGLKAEAATQAAA